MRVCGGVTVWVIVVMALFLETAACRVFISRYLGFDIDNFVIYFSDLFNVQLTFC